MTLSLKQAIDALNGKHLRSAIGAFNINDMTDMHSVMQALDVIARTRELTDAPIVMHGVKKVNIGTEVKHAYTSAMRNYAAQMDKEIDPRAILVHAKEAVQRVVESRLAVLNTPRTEELV